VNDPKDPRIPSQKVSSLGQSSNPASSQNLPAVESDEEDAMNGEVDEEEEMNAAAPMYDIEEETNRHRPREPTIAILSRLDNVSLAEVSSRLLALTGSAK
jgi:hypothetical protein